MRLHTMHTLAAALIAVAVATSSARADWFYNSSGGYITNETSGASISVSKYTADGADALKATYLRSKASDNAYDFSQPILDAGTNEWFVTYHANYLSGKGQTSVILSPRTTYLQKDFMYSAATLTSFEMDCPLLTYIGEYAVNGAVNLTGVDASDWNLDSLMTIGNCAMKGATITGTLKLPACTTLVGQSFRSLTQLEELWLTSPDLPANAFDAKERFAGLFALTNLVIGSTSQMTADGRAVSGWEAIATSDGSLKGLQSVTFHGPAPTIRFLSSLFNQTTNANPATLNLSVHASKNQLGWTELPGLIAEPELIRTNLGAVADAYAEKIDSPRLIGLYPIQELSGKYAWIMHERSPHDPAILPQSVVVASGPAPLTSLGAATPAYGIESNVVDGTVFTVAPYAGRDGALYEAAGYVVERMDPETDNWIEVASGIGRSWTYSATNDQVRLTWLFEAADGYGVIFQGNGRSFVDSMTAPLCTDESGNPYYAAGTAVAMTATDNPPEASFEAWVGDVTSTNRMIAFTVDEAKTLTPAMSWYHAAGAITDPVSGAKFSVTTLSATNRTLKLASRSIAAADGIYDFSKRILDADENRWYLTQYANVFSSKNDILEMTLSREAVSIAKDFCYGCSKLEKLVLDCPALTSLGQYAFIGASLSRTDTSTWNLDSLVSMGGGVFQSSGLSGILTLPSPVSMSGAEFANTSLTDLRLTSPDLSATVFDAHQIFWGCSAITNLVMGSKTQQDAPTRAATGDSAIACGGGFSNLEAATFYGPAPTAHFLTSLLGASTRSSPDNLTLALFGSRQQDGWNSLAGLITDRATIRTELGEYAENYEDLISTKRLIGLYPIQGLSGKYVWIMHNHSPYDPPETIILFR